MWEPRDKRILRWVVSKFKCCTTRTKRPISFNNEQALVTFLRTCTAEWSG